MNSVHICTVIDAFEISILIIHVYKKANTFVKINVKSSVKSCDLSAYSSLRCIQPDVCCLIFLLEGWRQNSQLHNSHLNLQSVKKNALLIFFFLLEKQITLIMLKCVAFNGLKVHIKAQKKIYFVFLKITSHGGDARFVDPSKFAENYS